MKVQMFCSILRFLYPTAQCEPQNCKLNILQATHRVVLSVDKDMIIWSHVAACSSQLPFYSLFPLQRVFAGSKENLWWGMSEGWNLGENSKIPTSAWCSRFLRLLWFSSHKPKTCMMIKDSKLSIGVNVSACCLEVPCNSLVNTPRCTCILYLARSQIGYTPAHVEP